jgi:hypothetical protein
VKARREGREWLMTRIPARLFRDYGAKGPLFTVRVRCVVLCCVVSCRSRGKGGKRRGEERGGNTGRCCCCCCCVLLLLLLCKVVAVV